MNILITGATGFIGSHLTKRILDQGNNVIVLKRKVSNLDKIKKFTHKIRFYNIDELINFDEIFLQNNIDIIIHLSAMYSKEDKGGKMKEEMNKVNISIPEKLLNSAIKHNVKGFINTGTFFEYSLKAKKPISERTLIEPYNYYTVTKIKFENILIKLAKNNRIKAVTLKLFSPYGYNSQGKVISLIIESFLKNKRLLLTKGNQKLAFTYIDDIVEAYLLSIRYINNKNFKYDAFNIGNNHSYSLKEVVSFIKKISKKNIKIEFGKINNEKDEDLDIHCDSKKAKQKLNWSSKTNLVNGLIATFNLYKKSNLV